MTLELRLDWEAKDASKPTGQDDTVIPAGTHEIERIRHPRGLDCNWLVLKGTLIGASEGHFRDFPDLIIIHE